MVQQIRYNTTLTTCPYPAKECFLYIRSPIVYLILLPLGVEEVVYQAMKRKIIERTGGMDLAMKCSTPSEQGLSLEGANYKGSGLSQVPIAVANSAAAVTASPIHDK